MLFMFKITPTDVSVLNAVVICIPLTKWFFQLEDKKKTAIDLWLMFYVLLTIQVLLAENSINFAF